MLNALLRILTGAVVASVVTFGVAACSFGSTPVGQGTNNDSANKRRDGGEDLDATTTTKRRVSTRKTDARVEEEDMDAGLVGSSGDADGDRGQDTSKSDAGNDRKATGGSSGSGKKPDDKGDDKGDDKKTGTDQNKTQTKPVDAGMTTPPPPPPADAGPRLGDASMGDAGNPIGNLEELAKMSPSARTTATINKFLMTLGSGDAPASSIKEFLNSINDEVNCKMNPLSYECITACQAVGTTCALCILEDECRMTMLDICGVTALGGCIPRR